MSTPNITPAQIVGFVTALGGVALAFGLLNGAQDRVIVSAVCAAVGIALKISDAIIRHGRSRALTGLQAAAINADSSPSAATAAPAPTPAP